MLRLFVLLLFCSVGLASSAAAQSDGAIHRLEIRDGKVYHDGTEMPASTLPEGFDADGMSFTFEYAGPVMPAITLNGEVFALEGDRLVRLDQAEDSARPVGVMQPAEERRRLEQAYMQRLSEHDRTLYERLIEERDREEESLRLAFRYRQSQSAAERAELRAELRRQVELIFELKQENRRREVEQGEQMLEAMRERLAERERQRDEIVDRRLTELIGSEE